jgi:hypothetical protein
MQPDDMVDETQDIEFEDIEDVDQETDSDSSADTDEGQEKSTRPVFNEEQQKAFDKAMAEKTWKAREAERQAEDYRKRLEELEAKIPKEQPPEVPKVPDFYSLSDREIQEQLRQRDEAIAKRAEFDARQQAMQSQQIDLQRRQQAQAVQAQNEKIASYAEKAKKLGVQSEDLQSAANKIGQFGINPMLANHLIDLDDGSLGTLYLGENLLELDKLANMPANQALLYLDQVVMPKARKLKPSVNAAPDPLDTPRGAGRSPKSGGPKGATFE